MTYRYIVQNKLDSSDNRVIASEIYILFRRRLDKVYVLLCRQALCHAYLPIFTVRVTFSAFHWSHIYQIMMVVEPNTWEKVEMHTRTMTIYDIYTYIYITYTLKKLHCDSSGISCDLRRLWFVTHIQSVKFPSREFFLFASVAHYKESCKRVVYSYIGTYIYMYNTV